MLQRTIPIVTARPALAPWLPTQLSGQPDRVERVRVALESAVALALGHTPPGWLRELRLADGEAFVAVAPNLGHDSVESAEIAFDTLRHLLPDTDIYVGAARA
ncbi:MAG: hypothetical protein Q8R98_21905 [Rubrivivax sp.]|nr:hypothetical protein [Rubrivivax sp.]MDP3225000.1 hypothetical protein [Rubrivivax sp.]MDP3614508.1 hypothetical protein [Rubrivivax sp.]